MIEVTQPWVILSAAWQWYGQDKVHVKGLCDYPGYRKGSLDDKHLVTELHELFDACSLLVTSTISASISASA